MEENKIKVFATQIPCDEELEENEVLIEFEVEELLDEIEREAIIKYAKRYCDLIHPDDVDLSDYHERDLVEALDRYDFDYSSKATTEEMIEKLEDENYYISQIQPVKETVHGLDYNSQLQFDEIVRLFYLGSWSEREEIYNKITR